MGDVGDTCQWFNPLVDLWLYKKKKYPVLFTNLFAVFINTLIIIFTFRYKRS